MSSSPFAPSPTPISIVANTLGLSLLADKYSALVGIGIVCVLYLLAYSCFKVRHPDLSESANAASEALSAATQVPKVVQIDASIFSYKKDDGMNENNNDECAICLNEFEEGEKCRIMKKCRHVFHRSCIEQWFKVQQHCPLCRACVCIVIQP